MIVNDNKEESTSGQEVDRQNLKLERKRRKQAKKEAKRYEAQKQYEQKIINDKFRPKDQHVTIIPRECINNIIATNLSNNIHNNKDINLEEFPDLNIIAKVKPKKDETDIQTQPIQNLSKRSLKIGKDSSMCINISDFLVTKPVVQKVVKFHNSVKYEGNILDSSQPERHRGKKRETPKKKPLSKLKSQIIADQNKPVKSAYTGTHSPAFETYCDHVITDEWNYNVKRFLTDIVKFQVNLYKRDPIKGTAKKRYLVGLHEVRKYMVVKKIKLLIFAPNIRTVVEDGALETKVNDLIELAKENEIPYIFALSRWKLGDLTLKFRPISCVGIFDYSGAEEVFNDIINQLDTARNTYRNIFPMDKNCLNDSTEELVKEFITACSI